MIRTQLEINQEYTNVAAQVGDLIYKKDKLIPQEIEQKFVILNQLNQEAVEAGKLAMAMKEAANAPQPDSSPKQSDAV